MERIFGSKSGVAAGRASGATQQTSTGTGKPPVLAEDVENQE